MPALLCSTDYSHPSECAIHIAGIRNRLIHRVYTVFNAKQIDGKWGIHLTQVAPISCGWLRRPQRPRRSISPSICYRRHRHGLLGEAQEQLPSATRIPPVEAEGELVQVVVQVLSADRTLMSAQQPALQQRCY